MLSNLVVCSFLIVELEARMLILMSDHYMKCDESPIKYVDWKGIEFVYETDTDYFINGSLRTLKKIVSPWKMHYTIEKYDRGHWFTSMINRQIPDFCDVIADKNAPWLKVTKHLKRTECPYEEGSEDFNMVPFDPVLPDYFTFNMVGKYRVLFTSKFLEEDGGTYTECWKVGFEMVME